MPSPADFVADHATAVEQAEQRITPWIRRTPALRTDLDPRLVLKPENLQVTGSFKVRGAFNALLSLRERQPEVNAVCTVSSGNHGQALAYAASVCGMHAVVVIPQGANPHKIAATRAWGAEVVTDGVTFDNREEIAATLAAERNLQMVHPFENWDVIHGQATVGLELLEDCPDLSAVVCPVGGGGLLSGIALAVRRTGARVTLVGVEPESADDASRSFATGVHQRLGRTPVTLADGVKVLSIGDRSFEVIVQHRLVDEMVTVSEVELVRAINEVWQTARLFIEPTAALPLAAYRAGKIPADAAGSVALILSGGNFDAEVVRSILS
jgi:threonine dehydratase